MTPNSFLINFLFLVDFNGSDPVVLTYYFLKEFIEAILISQASSQYKHENRKIIELLTF